MHDDLKSLFDLTGKVAIVTGASRGLGVSFARGLAKAGAHLVICARNLGQLEQVAEELRRYGKEVIPVRADIRSAGDIRGVAEAATRRFQRIDILVNNAGISAVAPAEEMTEEEWQGVIDTNLTGVFRCAQQVGRVMLKQGSGKIINVASQYGMVGASHVSLVSYVASKTAVLGLTRELAVEWAPRGLHVTALAPGFFPSDQTVWAFKEGVELGDQLLKKVPMGRMGKLEELEGTIVYLSSSASDYMNGQALAIDGGFLSW